MTLKNNTQKYHEIQNTQYDTINMIHNCVHTNTTQYNLNMNNNEKMKYEQKYKIHIYTIK